VSTSTPPAERAWADIDLAALVANARTVAAVSGSRLLPMVKADGYGIGAIPVVEALEPLEPWGYGVATVAEGATLRSAGIRRPIVVFTPMQPYDLDSCRASGLRPVIGDLEGLAAWTSGTDEPFHVEIDTGMGRSGFRWDDSKAHARLGEVAKTPSFEGIFTHFHSGHDVDACDRQWSRFQEVVGRLPQRPSLVHAANSVAAMQGTRFAGDLVRPGIFLYGGAVAGHVPQPVVKLRTRVVAVRSVEAGDTVSYDATWAASEAVTIATLAMGYADGLRRSLSGSGNVEIDGQIVPIVGRVTMDMTMVAAPDSLRPGAVATVFGGRISLDQQADAAGTIAYELLTGMSARVHRRYGRTA
jgi:alanine racemase